MKSQAFYSYYLTLLLAKMGKCNILMLNQAAKVCPGISMLTLINKLFTYTLLVLLFSSCKKYEYGPSFSLRSKKERVANTWRIQELKKNAIVVSFDSIAFYRYHYTKDGVYQYTDSSGIHTGTWELATDKTEISSRYTVPGADGAFSQTYYQRWLILKLEEKSLWLRQQSDTDTYEFHLAPA